MAVGPQSSAPSLLKSLVKGTALYSVALFGQRLASVFLLPVNTHFLSPADYGVLDLLEQIGIVASVMLGMNISAALGFFYFNEDSAERRNTIVSTVFVGAVLIGLFAGSMGALLVNPIGQAVFGTTDYRPYLLFVFLSLPLGAVLEAQFSWLRVMDRPAAFAGASLARVGIAVVMTVTLLAVFKLRIYGVLASSLVAMVGTVSILGIYSFKEIRLTFDRLLFVRLFRFSFPIGIGSIGMFIINFGDRFVLSHYRSMADVGIYAVAYKIGMLISSVHSSFITYWGSQVYDVARRDDADSVIARIFTYMMLMLSFIALILVVSCRPAIGILATRPGFERAAVIAPLIVLAYYIRSVGDFFRCFLFVAGRSEYDAICTWIGAAVCIAGYAILIPRYGMVGAAVATTLTFMVIGVTASVWAYRLRPFHLEGKRIGKILTVSAGLLIVHFLMPVPSLVLQCVWALTAITAFPVLIWIVRFPLPGETQKLTSWLTMAMERTRRMMPG